MDREPLPVEEIAPLSSLAEEFGVSHDKMRRWADVDRRNNFPPEVERIGNVKFYERAAVERWIRLWRMTSKGKDD